MTPSQRAKELGCRSLAQVIKYSEVPERTTERKLKENGGNE